LVSFVTRTVDETSDDADARPLVADRGVARALLQQRIEAAKNRPEWEAAMRMAGALSPKGSNPREVNLVARGCIEDAILTFVDLVRAAGRQGRS